MLAPHGISELEREGFTLIAAALFARQAHDLAAAIERSLAAVADDAIVLRNRAGVYGARNILEVCPAARDAWRMPDLIALLRAVLGDGFGLVRGLYFDKPPARSWSLPWHQDLTIAVRDNRRPSRVFSKPTLKAGVPHVEAPVELLRNMLTLRMHLDDVTAENGPLQVLPGTHHAIHSEPLASSPAITIYARAGDVLAMRPLLFHASGASIDGTVEHRRVLHLEFASSATLPDDYRWHTYLRFFEI
jgi:ectoine hydroxylase-related dioxygenase (phytanoyl-CoA dioxygenase family)